MFKGFSVKNFSVLLFVLLLIALGVVMGNGLRTNAVMIEKSITPQLTEIKE